MELDGRAGNDIARYCIGCGYSLAGLTEPRCPECGRGFDPSDPRTWAPGAGQFHRQPVHAAVISAAIVSAGIALGVARLTESIFADYGISGLVLLWWCLVAGPAVHWGYQIRFLRSTWLMVIIGAVTAAAVFCVLPGTNALLGLPMPAPLWPSLVYCGVLGAIVGGAAGGVAAVTVRRPWVRCAAKPPARRVVALWAVGPVTVALWLFVCWPVVMRVSPDLAYRLGGFETRQRIVERVLDDFAVGDSVADLQAALPAFFSHPDMERVTAMQIAGERGLTQLVFEQGQIVEIKRPP